MRCRWPLQLWIEQVADWSVGLLRGFILVDIFLKRMVQSHFFSQPLPVAADAGRIGVSCDDGDLRAREVQASECEQQDITVIQLAVFVDGICDDLIILVVNIGI